MASKGLEWNRDDPLALCQGETVKANTALHDYYYLGPGRSLMKLYAMYIENKEKGESVPTVQEYSIRRWSMENDWIARVGAAKAIEDARVEAEWLERRLRWRQKEWSVAEKLSDKVQLMLDFPLSRRIVDSADGTQITIEPVDWRVGDVARLIDVASKLARNATEMVTERSEVRRFDVDYSKLTIEQIRRIADGEDIATVLASAG